MDSPCKKICKVEDGRCIGCHRSLDEIGRWRDMSDQERRDVMEELPERARIWAQGHRALP